MDDNPGISLHLRELKTLPELTEISSEWNELYEASPVATPFQSPSWIINWWKHFGNEKLWVVAVYNRRVLAGFLPIYIFNFESGNESLRQLTFIGTGNTDYMDILCRPELEAETIRMVSEFLAGSSNSWDICDFQELRQSSPMLNIKLGEEFEIKTTHSGVCPVTVLPESLDKYLHSLPVSFRKNIIRARRQLSDLGELSLEVAKEENLDEYMAWLFRLHNASWHKRNMPGLLAESALQDFHRETAKELFQNKIMRLYVLKHNGKVISAVYSLIKDSRLYYYIGGFDPVFSKFSPGSVILLEIIKNAISEGIRKFDFLRGSEDYKYKWNAEDRSNFRMFIKKKDH